MRGSVPQPKRCFQHAWIASPLERFERMSHEVCVLFALAYPRSSGAFFFLAMRRTPLALVLGSPRSLVPARALPMPTTVFTVCKLKRTVNSQAHSTQGPRSAVLPQIVYMYAPADPLFRNGLDYDPKSGTGIIVSKGKGSRLVRTLGPVHTTIPGKVDGTMVRGHRGINIRPHLRSI